MAEHPSPLLQTKLHTVRAQSGLVDRERIMSALDEIPRRRLTLISASAGFGKTTAISAWLERTGRHAAWVSLDAGDNSLGRFLHYVVAALQTVEPAIGVGVRRIIETASLPPAATLVDSLINDIASLGAEVILVLDDYQFVTDDEIHDAMSYLLEHAPAQLHIVLTSRADPPFPLSRLRVRKQLLEIRAADLRFTVEESADLFRRSLPVDLDERHVAALQKKTEGWIAGLQMAGLSLRGRDDVDGFIAAFTGADRYVLDYLIEEVLGSQAHGTQQVMLELSVLDRFNGPLCEAVTGFGDGAVLLEQLEEANLFLIPLDNRREWYRYHKLFGDLLQHRLRQLQPEKVGELHRRASRWFEAAGLVLEASQHALLSGDRPFLSAMLENNWRTFLRDGSLTDIKLMLSDALELDAILASARLALIRSYAAFFERDFGLMDRCLEAAERLAATETAAADYRDLIGQTYLMRGALERDKGRQAPAIEYMQKALDILPHRQPSSPDYLWYVSEGTIHTMLGSAYDQMREYDRAEMKYHEAIRFGRGANDDMCVVQGLGNLAKMLLRRGDFVGALRYTEELESLRESVAYQIPRTAATPFQVRSRIALDRNELEQARDLAAAGVPLAGAIDQRFDLLRTTYSACDGMGDHEGALAALEETERVPIPESVARLEIIGHLMRAHWLWRQGRIDMAEEVAGRYKVWLYHVADLPVSEIGDGELPLVGTGLLNDTRIDLARGRVDEAIARVSRIPVMLRSSDHVPVLVEALVLAAVAREKGRDHDGAMATLVQALVHAAGPGIIRPFVIEGAPVARLLQQLVAKRRPELASVPAEFLRALLAACRIADLAAMPATSTARALVADELQLTTREQEILGLLALGYSNQKIADKLYVSVNTIKTHMSNLFDKLGARSRVEALARAREAEIL